jgi:hypothetical protein
VGEHLTDRPQNTESLGDQTIEGGPGVGTRKSPRFKPALEIALVDSVIHEYR